MRLHHSHRAKCRRFATLQDRAVCLDECDWRRANIRLNKCACNEHYSVILNILSGHYEHDNTKVNTFQRKREAHTYHTSIASINKIL